MKGILRESLKLLLVPRFSDPEYFYEGEKIERCRGKKRGYNKTGPQDASEMFACLLSVGNVYLATYNVLNVE